MDDFLLPDDDTIERLAEEYGKLKKDKLSEKVLALSRPEKATVLMRRPLVENANLKPLALEALRLLDDTLLSLKSLLVASPDENADSVVASTISLKQNSRRKLASVAEDGILEPTIRQSVKKAAYGASVKELYLKQTNILQKLDFLKETARCPQTSKLIGQICHAEFFCLLNILSLAF